MPLYGEKHTIIFDELVNILGADYVTDDRAVMEAYSRDTFQRGWSNNARPDFIVLPGNTEDVQQIVKLANRYKFPFSVTSTGLHLATCSPKEGYPNWCFIDPKRMNNFEIDEKNMFAIVEPYVSHVQVQSEAMKVGLYNGFPGGGSQTSILANNIWGNAQWTCWRTGLLRNILGLEWVLPTGEILRTGSLAFPGAGWCWGEGPGPDARGILRGQLGNHGALGIVTKVAVKLYPWPGPKILHTEGVQPEKQLFLPPERFKSFFIVYSTLEASVDGIREMGKAEIGGVVLKLTPFDLLVWATKSREEYWERWNSEFWKRMHKSGHMIMVMIWGFTSEKQVTYEENVLKQIIKDTGGELVPEEVHDFLNKNMAPNTVRDTHRGRFMRIGGFPNLLDMSMDSLDDVLRSTEMALKIKDKYTPPLRWVGPQQKFWPADFGHLNITEVDIITEKSEEAVCLDKDHIIPDMIELNKKNSVISSRTFHESMSTIGPTFCNVHLLLGKIKRGLDPHYLANPTRLIDKETVLETKQ